MDKDKLAKVVRGHLKCENCKYDGSCEDLFDRCTANYILDDEVVHIKEYEDTCMFWEV